MTPYRHESSIPFGNLVLKSIQKIKDVIVFIKRNTAPVLGTYPVMQLILYITLDRHKKHPDTER